MYYFVLMHQNNWIKILLVLALSAVLAVGLRGQDKTSSYIRGITVVAPPQAFGAKPMVEIKTLHADWIAVVPFGFSRLGASGVHYNADRQWWGERLEGAGETIRLAKEQGLKVLLKPQIYVPGSWPGAIEFDTEHDWAAWESNYRRFILDFARLAEQYKADMLSIGTEFSISTRVRHEFWNLLIDEVREVYSGEITYAANWDEYTHVAFWDALDYIGVDAYFPLTDETTPTIDALAKAWIPIKKKLKTLSKLYNRPVLFTEYGYLSVDRCAHKNWLLENGIHKRPINEQAQSNAIEALLRSFADEEFWAGGFYWKWFPNMSGHEGYLARDYTFQGKLAEKTIKRYFRDQHIE